MTTWLLFLALLWPLLWVLRVAMAARVLWGMKFRPNKIRALSPAELPNHVREAIAPLQDQLAALGFRWLGGWQVRRFQEPSLDDYEAVFTHAREPVRAILKFHLASTLSGRCWTSFRTTTADGAELVTASFEEEENTSRPEAFEVEYRVTDSLPVLWTHHLARLTPHRATAWHCVNLEGAALREQYICDAQFAHLSDSPDFVHGADGELSYRLTAAIRRARRVLGNRAQTNSVKELARNPPPQPLSAEAQAAFDLQHYRQYLAFTGLPLSLHAKSTIAVVTCLAFVAVLAWTASPVVAVTLLVALVIHESGHLAGMRLFGHRDTQMVFIPFLGGAAVARDERILKPWQHIVIILLGPLPGFFLGLGLDTWAGDGPEWLRQAGLTLLGLNAFNLLPVLPLDGGQIVDFAFASRFPRIRVVFFALSALGLVFVGLRTDISILCGLGAVTFMRLPMEWRVARVRREMRREFPEGGDGPAVVWRLLLRLRELDWSKVPLPQRFVAVRALQHVVRMPRAGFGTLCFAALGYTAPIWGGAPILLWGVYRSNDAIIRQAVARAEAAGIGAARQVSAVTVPDADNGALLYARAESLAGELNAADADAANRQIVELLQSAARKPAFVPIARSPAGWRPASRGHLIARLNAEAFDKQRYGEPQAAANVLIDALRLTQAGAGASRWMRWPTYRNSLERALDQLEELTASGVPLQSSVISDFLALLDERVPVAFAARELPAEWVERAGIPVTGDEAVDTRLSEAWLVAERFDPAAAKLRANAADQAIALDRQLRRIVAGEWPDLERPVPDGSEPLLVLAELSDLLARMRLARAALLIDSPPRPEDRRFNLAEVRHPFTREAVKRGRRGAVDVLALASAASRLSPNPKGGAELIWRLPLRPVRP